MQIVLTKVVAGKAIQIEARKQQQPLTSFQNEIQPSTQHFYGALQGARAAFILEYEKALPSKGVTRDDFDSARIAVIYKHYTSAILVLTDEKYFQGGFNFLPIISQIVPQPILCKDFIIDPYQIYLARCYRTDVCLLILSVLDGDQYRQLAAVAHSLEMGVLTETSNEGEQERAIALGVEVTGINNHDPRDLSIDLNHTHELTPKLRYNVTVVSGPGINTYARVRELSHFANDFLIGSTLMTHNNLYAIVRRVLLDENGVCGLTRGQGAKAAYDVDMIYDGLIFATTSPRCVNVEQAQKVMAAASLQYVSVFRNHNIAGMVGKTKVLSLATVQLHGNEEQLYIDTLREALPAYITIWKTLSIGGTLPARELQHVDEYVLDNSQGESGQRFDWSPLNGQSLGNILLMGGLGADNHVEAAQAGCVGLDLNSAVESQPGVKGARPLASIFQTLRVYQREGR